MEMMTFPAWKDGWGKVFSSNIVVNDGSDIVRSYLSPYKKLQQRGSYTRCEHKRKGSESGRVATMYTWTML